MTLGVEHPGLLPWLALLAAPVLIHLFARARPPRFEFPSLWFLLRVRRSATRASRPRDWLLIALRTLLALALVGLFLKPRVYGSRAGAAEVRNVVVVVDASASMSAADGAQTRFALACAEASALLEGLGPDDRANLVWMRSPPQPVFPEPGSNTGLLRDHLRAAAPSLEAGDPAAALRLAAGQLEGLEGSREICVVSDFQASQWTALPVAPPGVRLVLVAAGSGAPAHMSISAPRMRPARPLAGEEVTLSAEVRNHSPAAARAAVVLDGGAWSGRAEVEVAPWSSAPVSFSRLLPEPGVTPVTLRLPPDAFLADDRAFALVEVRPRLVAGLTDADDPVAALWRRALGAMDWIETVTLPPAGFAAALSRCDLAVLPGWQGAEAPAVAAWVRTGGVLLWPVSAGVPGDALHAVAADAWPSVAAPLAWIEPSNALTLSVAAPDDAMFKLFEGGGYGNPAGGVLTGRWSLPPPAASRARTLIQYADGAPALVRAPAGSGMIAVWNIDLRPETGNWAGRLEFLPVVGELLASARHLGTADPALDTLVAGVELDWRADREARPAEVAVGPLEGTPLTVARETDGLGVVFRSAPAPAPGFYTWTVRGEPVRQAAVNFPPAESDLRTMSPTVMAGQGIEAAPDARQARARREGVPLWPSLAALAALLIAVESIILWRTRPA